MLFQRDVLLPEGFEEFRPKDIEYCTLAKLISYNDLQSEYETKIKLAQDKYIEEINFIKNEFEKNITACKEADKIFNTSDNTDVMNNTKGLKKCTSKTINCPFKDCNGVVQRINRHFKTKHPSMNNSECLTALEICKIIKRNRNQNSGSDCVEESMDESEEDEDETAEDIRNKGSTKLLSNRGNFKLCCLCKELKKNMVDHLQKKHKLNKSTPEYKDALTDSNVIPSCYLSSKDGIVKMLDGVRLVEAKRKYESIVSSQQEAQDKIKKLRIEIKETKEQIKEGNNEELINQLQLNFEKIQKDLSEVMHPNEFAHWPQQILDWKQSFTEYLKTKNYQDHVKRGKIALRVLEPYMKTKKFLNFEEILDGTIMTDVLNCYKANSNYQNSTKIRYLKICSNMIAFLTTSCHSPERPSTLPLEIIQSRKFHLKDIEDVFDTAIKSLEHKKVDDEFRNETVKEKKLLENVDINKILANNRKELKKIENINAKVNTSIALQFRDNLICLCFMKLGSRSMAIANMTIEEVGNAVKIKSGGEIRRNINVKNHKSQKRQTKAVIPLTEIEYSWINKYIKTYRPVLSKLCNPTDPVFTKKFLTEKDDAQKLSLQSINYIMKKFKLTEGMTLNSRNIRISKITNTVKEEKNICDVPEDFAHNLSTSERYCYKNINHDNMIDMVEGNVPGPSGLCTENQSFNSGKYRLLFDEERS